MFVNYRIYKMELMHNHDKQTLIYVIIIMLFTIYISYDIIKKNIKRNDKK